MAADKTKLIFNPISGSFDAVQNVASLVEGPASATDNALARYDLATGKLLQDSGVTLDDSAVLSGPSNIFMADGSQNRNNGILNYIKNGHAEVNTAGWATYADAAGTQPVDGTGGTATYISFSRQTADVLRGSATFNFGKSSSFDAQGMGASYDFTIDNADCSKVLQITFDYKFTVPSTFVAGTSTTNSDVTVWIYDIVNSTLIQPSTYKLFSNSVTIPDSFRANFQTSANSASYRLIFHVSNPTTDGFNLALDNIAVSPTTYALGTVITDWQSYTPTYTQMGTVTTHRAKWRRVGGDAELDISWTPGSTGASEVRASLPSGLVAAAAPILRSGAVNAVGVFFKGQTSNDNHGGPVLVRAGEAFLCFGNTYTFGGGGVDPLTPVTSMNAAGFTYELRASIPIAGWSSQTITSDVSDQRIVVAHYALASSFTVNASTPMNFATKVLDTHAAVTTGAGVWKFTAPIAGLYRVSTHVATATASAGMALAKNNSVLYNNILRTGTATDKTWTGTVQLNAGDYIDIRSGSGGSNDVSTAYVYSFIEVERISNPAILSATETVAARYVCTSNSGGGLSNPLQWQTKTYDTHGAVTLGSAWKFTAPIAGLYQVNWIANNGTDTANWVYKNGSQYQYAGLSRGSSFGEQNFLVTVQLNAGDYIDIRQAGGTNLGAAAPSGPTIEVRKVG
jgi:hypothetical protein